MNVTNPKPVVSSAVRVTRLIPNSYTSDMGKVTHKGSTSHVTDL